MVGSYAMTWKWKAPEFLMKRDRTCIKWSDTFQKDAEPIGITRKTSISRQWTEKKGRNGLPDVGLQLVMKSKVFQTKLEN